MKRFLTLLIISLLYISCDGLITQKKTSEEYMEEELKTINWNEVDTYPLFPDCDESEPKTKQQSCFETTLHNHLKGFISNQELVSSVSIQDTLLIHLSISKGSDFIITEISGDSLTFAALSELQNQLYESIRSLPKIAPALKRGIPVSTTFILPLVIKSN